MISEKGLVENVICGTAISAEDIYDRNLMALVKKHFNAVTLENELKPVAVLGGYPVCCPLVRLRTIEWESEKLQVPLLNHSRADQVLNVLLKWNKKHPDQKIRVRGHVLVWHAQTPEWFFHEGYDKRRPYVSRKEMDRRLKWYIHEVLNYYTAPDSRYCGLFYGWDVVNDAASDSSGSRLTEEEPVSDAANDASDIWRTDEEPGNDCRTDDWHTAKSSWWTVYGSEEYVINAFRYANQYAPPDVKLFYNDHSEWHEKKAERILEVLRAIREHAGAPGKGTRIDGLGMQGHYRVNQPEIGVLKERIIKYAHEADSIMLTELDLKADPSFDGTEESRKTEYARQAEYYAALYKMLVELKHWSGINISGITFWGVIDSYSWLMRRNLLGGGSEKTAPQCPLLFDGNYKAKPAFWAFTDPDRIINSQERGVWKTTFQN